MDAIVPNRFLFRFEFPLRRAAKALPLSGEPADWGDRFLLPELCSIDGQTPFARVFGGWSEAGLYVAARVAGKARALRCDPTDFRHSDCMRLMTDMRDTRSIRRATRFCQQFFFLPAGGGAKRREACAGLVKIPRATEDAPLAAASDIHVASRVAKDGYGLTVLIPARSLVGFDPSQNPRIGFFVMLEDTELGHQSLTINDDLNWWLDPSTWPTAVLTE